MRVKNISWTIIKSFTVLIGSAVLGLLLLVLAYFIPLNAEKKESTFQFYEQMGWAPRASMRYEQYAGRFDTFAPDVLDDGTDKLILAYSLDDSGGNLFQKAAYMQGYGRYWQGYVVLLRPLFYFLDYWDFALYNGMLQVCLVCLLALLVWKQTGRLRYALAALSSYLLLMPVALAPSLQFTPVFYLAFGGSIAAVCGKEYLFRKDHLSLFFLILGILTCYFDFLTYPLLAWAFPLCWYLIVKKDALSVVGQYVNIVFSALSWILGYVGMFLAKWILLYVICGPEVYRQCNTGHAFDLIGMVSDEHKVSKQTYSRFDVLYTNWRHYLFGAFVLLIIAWLLWAVWTKLRYDWKVRRECVPFLLISVSAPAWYLVFAAHTAIHHFFTYRTYGASILAVLLFLCSCVERGKDGGRGVNWRAAAALVVCLCIGWGGTVFAKENVRVANDQWDWQTVPLAPGDLYECGFYASFRDIRKFGICARAGEDLSGSLRVRIYDEALVYETAFPVEELTEWNYVSGYTEWKLKPGKEYRMTVSVEGNEQGVELVLTREGDLPLSEYRNSSLNGSRLGEVQPLGDIVYNNVVLSRRVRVYLAFLTGCYLWLLYGALEGLAPVPRSEKLRKGRVRR